MSEYDMMLGMFSAFGLLFILWYIVAIVQMFMAYGTAYRLTKTGGDNGVALFGWMLLVGFAAMIPGLGIYLWIRYKDHPKNPSGEYRDEFRDEFRNE